MRGKKAKFLRSYAAGLLIHEGKSPGEGYNTYNVQRDGAVTCGWQFRVLYHLLKKAWMRTKTVG